jgi:RNA polymerase sigma-70 factor (ECF subfamily)
MVIEQVEAAGAFISANQSWLQRFLSGKLGCNYDAQDISQDTFIRVLTSSVNLGDLKEPRAYLATIANRLIIDKARRKKLEQAYIEARGIFLEDQYAPSSEEVFESINKLEALVKLLEGLGEKPRSAFLMSRLDGMAYKEIAVELDVSVSMIKKYIAKALVHCYDVMVNE